MKGKFSNLALALIGAFFLVFLVEISGCKAKEGCTDPLAENYNPDAETEDSTCVYPDPCESIHCVNGTCADGRCVCEDGFYGTHCASSYLNLYAGNYAVTEFCLPDTHSYACTISQNGSNNTQIVFSAMYEQPIQVYADFDSTALVIPLQPFGNDQIGGSGTLDTLNQSIHLDFSILTGGPTEFCNATLIRQ